MEIQLWREVLAPYQLAVDELVVKFNHIIRESQTKGIYSPIERVEGRVKSLSSLLDKMQKKDVNINDLEEKIKDIAGIRIICQFVEDIYRVVEIIDERSDMRILEKKDYIKMVKNTGYRSFHLIVEYEVNTLDGAKKLPVEIQVRTLAMDFWATVEHSLHYKYQHHIPEYIQDKLINASNAIVVLDQEMSAVRDEILDAQNSFRIKANLVSDILHNLQNLYKVGNRREVQKIQEEFYKVYAQDDIELLTHFGHQLDMIAEGHGAQSLQ
ncbi:MAG: GTP pyrophosphokinase family protein [Lachnospiraceae bacterium]|nr:GTP pyrophosphokinase family protein [Lachnospiraceae bacterium]